MNSPIVLRLDRSGPQGLFVEREGKRVSLEEAFKHGFVVTPDDAPAVLTLAQAHIDAKEAYSL